MRPLATRLLSRTVGTSPSSPAAAQLSWPSRPVARQLHGALAWPDAAGARPRELRERRLRVHQRRERVAAASSLPERVEVSSARLDQLLEAEITTMSLQETSPMMLQSILGNAGELGLILHEELPVRFAHRIKMLESLPEWEKKTTIAAVRQMYMTSFKELRLSDPHQPKQFQELLYTIKERHSPSNLLVVGFREYAEKGEMSEEQINLWLDKFFLLRVSTNMLTSHYLQIAEFDTNSLHEPGGSGVNPYQSSINPQCNPDNIARHAAQIVNRMCYHRYGCAPEIKIKGTASKPFPFVPRYLLYIISELLKNAVRATVERSLELGSETMPQVTVLVSGDEHNACIRISDEAGGFEIRRLEHVWSYLYSTAEPVSCPISRVSVDAPTDVRHLPLDVKGGRFVKLSERDIKKAQSAGLSDVDDAATSSSVPAALGGLGCGLPLCRLYARYLGGDVELQTLPRFGTDVFVYLNRLDNSSEILPLL